MSVYTDQLAKLVAKSNGKVTIEELDRTIAEGAACADTSKWAILHAMEAVFAWDEAERAKTAFEHLRAARDE